MENKKPSQDGEILTFKTMAITKCLLAFWLNMCYNESNQIFISKHQLQNPT